MESLDFSIRICYTIHSDQVAESRDACDRKEDLRALLFLLYFWGCNVMPLKPIKPFLTYEGQINKLTMDKGLTIADTNAAKISLENIGYYALIGGYKQLLYNPMTRKYLPGTTFDDILSLYTFDKNLRELVFKYICRIEQKLRSLISYGFSETYSPNETEYLNAANYNNTHKNAAGIHKLIQMLTIEAHSNTNHPYVVYQRTTYNNVPLWVIVNTLTFGQLSKMYSFLKTGVQSKISRAFNGVSEKELGQYLKALTHFRNVCAHNERLFSFRCRLDIPDTVLHKKLGIPQTGTQYLNGKTDLFAVIIAFRYLLSREDFLMFKRSLTGLIDDIAHDSHTLTENKLLDAMGFPTNWKSITRYRL